MERHCSSPHLKDLEDAYSELSPASCTLFSQLLLSPSPELLFPALHCDGPAMLSLTRFKLPVKKRSRPHCAGTLGHERPTPVPGSPPGDIIPEIDQWAVLGAVSKDTVEPRLSEIGIIRLHQMDKPGMDRRVG